MHVASFIWPDDLDATERAAIEEIEDRVRGWFDGLSQHTIEEYLRDEQRIVALLDRATGRTVLTGKLRIVVGFESYVRNGARRMGLRVRFQWHRYEQDRRYGAAQERARVEAAERSLRGERARPPRYVPAAGHEPRGGELERAGVQTIAVQAYGASIEVSERELREATERSPLEIGNDLHRAIERIAEVERLSRMGLATNPHAVGDAVLAELAERRAREDREFRREVIGEFRPRRPTYEDSSTPRTASSRPIAAAICQRLAVTFADFLDGCVVRTRADGPPMSCRGDAEAALAEMMHGRRPDDRFYFVRGSSPAEALARGLPPMTFALDSDPMAEIPGTLAWSNAQRRRAAVELVLRICYVVACAHARARDRAEVFYTFARACLEPWSRNPSPIELDIERAPFGVDLEPAEDATAARFALLELK